MSCLPAFLLGVSGSELRIHGAIFLDRPLSRRLASNSLVRQLYTRLDDECIYADEQHDRNTAHMLRTLRVCLNDLDTEYEGMKPRSDELSSGMYHSPHFKAFKSEKGEYFSLIYRFYLVGSPLSTQPVFLADAVPREDPQSPIRCVVKFTRQYGDEGHKLMESEGVAAKLLFCEFEVGMGLWVVVTHYYECEEDAVPSEEGIAKLRQGLRKFHDAGFVHGDIRSPNVLVGADRRPLLIDFDWSCKVGVARYPIQLNMNLKWPEGTREGGLIETRHDTQMLDWYVEGQGGKASLPPSDSIEMN